LNALFGWIVIPIYRAAQLTRNTLGQKRHHAHERQNVFWHLQGRSEQSTYSNAISFNACICLRAWQRQYQKRIRSWPRSMPSNVILQTAPAQARHSNVIRANAFGAGRAWQHL
jgi:hypothetical protein